MPSLPIPVKGDRAIDFLRDQRQALQHASMFDGARSTSPLSTVISPDMLAIFLSLFAFAPEALVSTGSKIRYSAGVVRMPGSGVAASVSAATITLSGSTCVVYVAYNDGAAAFAADSSLPAAADPFVPLPLSTWSAMSTGAYRLDTLHHIGDYVHLSPIR